MSISELLIMENFGWSLLYVGDVQFYKGRLSYELYDFVGDLAYAS